MNLRYLITLIISAHVFFASFGQTQQDINNLFRDANAYFYFEDYEEALALYLDIYESFPNNQNIDYRIGICYLNIADQKTKAITYLERAIKNASNRYNENSIKETKAPLEAHFYLGNAYYIANRFKEAKSAFETYKNSVKNERKYNVDYLNHQLEGLERAKTFKNYPVNLLRSNLGETINNRFPNFNPVISGDGKTMAFTTKERFYQSINISKKVNGKWGKPTNITLDLVVNGNCSTLSLNNNGTELYLFKDDNHDGNIYVSNFSDDKWTPMIKLNENINTESYETHASISADGSKLYFASNREGGFGDLDIYVSHRDETGNWGPAVNLGRNINTQFNENAPFITTEGNILFFSSDGHNTMGGYDIFFSQLQADNSWSTPINLGYPINTTDDEVYYQPIDDGAMGLTAFFDPKGYGQTDIVQIEIFLPRYKRSIVSSSDFYARKSTLPPKTLIIDTVNVAGVALLDPSRPEHINYLANDSRHTLFFEGKSYDLQDQSTVKSLIAAQSDKAKEANKTDKEDKAEKKIDDDRLNAVKPIANIEHKEENENPIDITSLSIKKDTTLASRTIGSKVSINTEDTEAKDTTKLTESRINQVDALAAASNTELFEILSALANGKLNPKLLDALNQDWNLPTEILRVRLTPLVSLADSLNQSTELTRIFASLLDIITAKTVESLPRQTRQIAQSSLDEEFFFRLQNIKRKASPGLALLLDDAILTQPDISSFKTLLEYLLNKKAVAFKPYISEFLTLIAEESIYGFNALSKKHKQEIHTALTQRHTPIYGIVISSIIAFLGLILLLFALKRSRKRKSKKL